MEILFGVILITLVLIILNYNKIKRLEINVQEGNSGIDVALSKRFNVITNLVEVVKGYAKHERETFKLVVDARQDVAVNRSEYENQMNEAVTHLMALTEGYPDLKASEQFLHLQQALADTEEHLQASRRLYNRNVSLLNQAISVFPGNLINALAQAKPALFYQAQDTERTCPAIHFES